MKIIAKEILRKTPDTKIIKLEVLTLDIAHKAKPGQFVMLMVTGEGERIPLTVVDKTESSITLIFQEVGLTTKLLGKLNVGDFLSALFGPLGHPTKIKNYGRVILIGGGVGIAEIYPIAKALKQTGNHLTTILGARTKELLILEKELKDISDQFYVTTDDGTSGKRGFVTDILVELLNYQLPIILRQAQDASSKDTERNRSANYQLIYAAGPIPMMRKVSQVTKDTNIKTIVSLNATMVDATGMCGCCRVNIGGQIKFTCRDGPEFDAQMVDWDELEKRNKIYLEKEKHICNLYKL